MRRGIMTLVAMAIMAMTLAPLTTNRAAAAAPAVPNTTAVNRALPITGTLPDGGTFVGTFNLENVAAQGGNLVANGALTGTLTDALGNVLGTVSDQAATLPLAVSGTCQILHLVLGPLDLNLLGLMVHLNQVVLDITAQSGPGNLLGNLLCAVVHLLDGGGGLGGLVTLLNRILGQLFPMVPISGTVAGGGNFVGTLTVQNFSAANDALSATTLLSGTLTNSLGQIIGSVINQAVNLLVTAAGTCQILNLTLGPLDLNLLGLMVHLNQVVLNITAQSGPGNLLGNLLCAVAHLLDGGGPLSQIAALLNRILTFL